eukprot:756748-Hanusia_phi.AAC.3
MEMSLGANIMRRLDSDPNKTLFTLITHVNPGGLATTQFGAMLTNRLRSEEEESNAVDLTILQYGVAQAVPPEAQRGCGSWAAITRACRGQEFDAGVIGSQEENRVDGDGSRLIAPEQLEQGCRVKECGGNSSQADVRSRSDAYSCVDNISHYCFALCK